jgi:hypothetical protein
VAVAHSRPGAPSPVDPDGVRRMAVDMLHQAWVDLEHPERRVAARRWFEGWHAPLPAAVACELAGLDVGAVRERLRDRPG